MHATIQTTQTLGDVGLKIEMTQFLFVVNIAVSTWFFFFYMIKIITNVLPYNHDNDACLKHEISTLNEHEKV